MKNVNLIEMLRGCSKRNGMAVSASNPDGQPTVNRQSRLMSHRGYLRNLAMIFAVLVMSMANVGTAWGKTGTMTWTGDKLSATATASGDMAAYLSGATSFTTSGTGSKSDKSGYFGSWPNSSAGSTASDYNSQVYTTFTVTSGYTFEPTSITLIVRPNNTGSGVRGFITDGTTTIYSTAYTGNGSDYTLVFDVSGNTPMSGTIKVGIDFTNTTAGKHLWIKSGISITGTVEEAAAPVATPRKFKSGERIYFKDDDVISGVCMKYSGDKLWAVFNGTGDWIEAQKESGTWDEEGAIYYFDVPGENQEYDFVIFTRNGWGIQTGNESTDIGKNMFVLTSYDGNKTVSGTWSKYASGAALIGDFNDWDPDQGKFVDGRVILELEANTDYEFKVLVGDGTINTNYWSCTSCGKATNTVDPWQQLYSNQNNWSMRSAEAGEYCFHWNNSTHYLGIYYPQARLKAGEYIYFDSRDNSTWKAADFTARYYFKYYDSGSDQSNKDCTKANATDTWVYNTTVPNNDYIGRVQMNRMVSGSQQGVADLIYAKDRTSTKQNCIHIASGSTATNWTTYCPPMNTLVMADNGTTTYGAGDGTSGNPYIVAPGSTIKVHVTSATTVPDDPNMTKYYQFKNGSSSIGSESTSTEATQTAGSDGTTHTIIVEGRNKYNDAASTVKKCTLYYAAKTIYDITYNKGSYGTGTSPIVVKKIKGVNITLRGETYTRTGYTQTAWNTNSAGTGGTSYALSASYTSNAALTLYPTWTANQTTVTLNPNTANHGTGSNVVITATYDAALSSFSAAVPAAGYQLKGYYTDATGGTKVIDADGTFSANSGIWNRTDGATLTLYAQYEDASYSVTHTLSNVTSSGATTATHGTNYTAVFAGAAGYNVPDAITVTIGGSTKTAGTEYTWDSETGTVVIDGDYITGAIVITVTGVSSCTTPANPDGLAAGSISSSDVTFTITDDESPASYEIYYSTSSTAPESSTPATTTTTSTTKSVTGLTANTTYYAWVRAVCNDDYKSNWVALTGSTFKTLAEGTKYYLFTPTSAPNPSHTGTLSGAFISPSATSSSETIDTYTFTKNITFGGTLSSISGNKAGDKNITYYNKTSSTKFTLYVKNTNGSQQILYINKIVEGETSVTVANCTIPASTAKSVEYTYETSDNTTFAFSVGSTSLVIYQIVVEEAGTAHKVAGENGYALNLNKGRVACPLSDKADISVNGFLIKAPYNNYKFTNSAELQIDKDKESSSYIKFTTPASPGRLKLTYGGSGGVEMSYNTKASDDGATSITSGTSYTLSGSTTYYLVNTGTQTAKITKIEFVAPLSGYTVSIAANPAGYGTVSSSSVTSVASGTTLSTSTNTLSVGATNVTATPADASAQYTYAFSNWTKSDGTALPSTVTSDLSVYANFTRTANNYTLAWSSNGGSELSGDYTSGSTAYGASITAPSDPTLSNYTFDGWNTNNDGTGTAKGSTMPAANTTYYAAWKQTVTLTTGAQGSGSNQTPVVYLNGTSVSDFTAHTASGYTLQGYYTVGSGGVKVLNADGTFASANVDGYITSGKWSRTGAAPTLYAQWVASEDCRTLKYVWKVTGNFCDDQSTATSAVSMISENDYFTLSGTGYKQESGKSLNLQNTQNNYFLLTAKTGYQIKSICFYGKVQDSSVDYTTDGSTWSSFSSTNTSGDDYYSFSSINASAFGIKLTAASPEGVWIRNMVIEVCAEGGTTYSVTYNDNGKTGGSVPSDDTDYSYGAPVTVKGNTGSLEKTNYTFAGWTTNNDGTGSNYVADNTFSITGNTTLYAKWTQSVTLNKNGGSTDGSATAVWNATGLTGITHAKPAAGYKLLGYYSEPSDGTKVLNSDGSFAATNVTGYITSGKWSRTSATTLYAEYESAGALTWNLIVNSDTTNLSTSTKTSAFTEISTTNMTNATLAGDLTYEKSKKSALTGKISTPASYDADDYVYVTFQVASGYKFTPSSIKVIAQPVTTGKDVKLSLTDGAYHSLVSSSATSISGGSTQTVTLAGDGTYFTGTVTLKIYCYGAADKYRLGTPITIEGEIEETCATMPSYKSMSYTTTTFAPDADASGSPITIVGGDNINTYQWKYNTVNDRTSGTNCGTNNASLTPLTDAVATTDGTRYYWCEMTNTSCGITIKSPAVAITVAAAKSDASVTWTDPASTPNYGGGGYTIKATVDQTGWDGNAADLVITAPAGIRIYNVSSGTTSNQKWVQADFDVQTSFDRTTYASNIPFTVSAAATASYNAISNDHNTAYSACSGGGVGSSYNIRVRKSYDKDASNNYRWVTPGAGEITYAVGSSISSGKAGTAMATVFDSIMSSDKQYIWVKTFVDNIKQMRLYVETSGANVSVSALYQRTTYAAADAKDVITGYSVVYDEDDDAENTGTKGQHTIDLIFTSALSANDIICVKFSSSKVKALGAAITEGSAGSLNTYLQWSGGLSDGATVAKNTTDAYFTYSASKITSNTNTLGAITYSSSDPSVATVDATGKVALVAAGSTTIKATLAASGCYKKAEISYTLNVTEVPCAITAGTLTLTSGTESKCSSANVTLTLTGFESDASIQWKDGDTDINNGGNYTIATDGTTSTLTTNQPGTYSVMVTKDCSVRSNRITISNKSTEVGAKRIVKNWYIKNGRPTPDIELWTLQNGAHLNSVAWDPVNATGLTASDFYESDGKVYLKGKEPSSNASGEDINYTLTLTVEDDCGSTTAMSASGQLIYLHHQKNTDKHVLAFVVTGTEKGGFTEGITADQTTSVELYNTIAANFDVLATNVYSTDDEQALKEYYSQFDILCVTDYPNTGTEGVNKKSYVDALGALVDIRPILTMEAFVAKLANWKAKGISGTPQSPTTRQYSMLLQCKDHEIFAGTKLTKVGEGDETMYRVSMVCDTLEDYKTLDATYGAGTHEKDKNYQYGKKPALQGFTFTREMLDDDLLPLGLIDDGSGNDLQVGIERQTEMEARLMVLGINSYAMERLTDDGQTVVVNALKYLMKKNSEDIADCSNTFVGGDDEEDESTRDNWDVASHWSGNAVPDRTQKVRIVAPCVIPANVKPHVTGVIIAPSGKYNHGANTANGSLTIAAGGALIVDGKVEAATAPLYTETRATSAEDLTIQTSSTAQGALIFDNDKGDTKATVEMYSLGRKSDGHYQFQYFAVPMEYVDVNPAFAGSGIYTYVWHEATGWERRGYYTGLEAFEGVGITTKSADPKTYTMTGALASTATKEITLTKEEEGYNLIGNSWTAPIQISQLEEDNSSLSNKTVYIYNAGNDTTAVDGYGTGAGQWTAIPFNAAGFGEWSGLKVIPAMQAFELVPTSEETLTLDYEKVVRGDNKSLTEPLHAPRRVADHAGIELMRIRVADSQTRTDLHLFEGERFSDEFDNGWEAAYMDGDEGTTKLYADVALGRMAVVATDELEGTLLGFAPGKEMDYTFSFGGEGMGYYLNDLKLKTSTLISEDATYSFTYGDGDTNRFYISRTPLDAPQTSTGVDNTGSGEVKARKFIYRDKMYIMINGRVYSVDGALVK